ncbi:hypothetical protein [Amazonocrinis nigriterrae]|uniref:hypothetical protein n=1 Tax=Amazonocrinis nigriterrae TaxID=2840443 RepID=UPI001BE45F11|nr:hypothetical protein [Amazonocrinis nigriterrae]
MMRGKRTNRIDASAVSQRGEAVRWAEAAKTATASPSGASGVVPPMSDWRSQER